MYGNQGKCMGTREMILGTRGNVWGPGELYGDQGNDSINATKLSNVVISKAYMRHVFIHNVFTCCLATIYA